MPLRDDEYFAIKTRSAAVFLKIPHVTAVGLGGRERAGQPTGEIVIKVFVARKKPASDVPPEELIPPAFEGVPTDVVEMGPPEPFQLPPGAIAPVSMPFDNSRSDPLRGGIHIIMEQGSGGTLGCIVRDMNDATAVYGLTNHHVVTKGALSLSRQVLHRSFVAGESYVPIGYVAAGANEPERDAAIVRLLPGLKWLPEIKDIGFVGGTHDVTVSEAATQTYPVQKRGAKTGHTGGVVIAIGTQWAHFASREMFDLVIRGTHTGAPSQQVFFSFRGDSGSAVLNEDKKVVALLWGGEFETTAQFPKTFATPIKVVLDRFKRIDKLDLQVATFQTPTPFESNETKTVEEVAGAPLIADSDVVGAIDGRKHRPLSGGMQVTAEPFLGGQNAGTLGCIVTQVGEPNSAYFLTSYGVISANGTRTPNADTDVGQPNNDDSCSLCCSDTVGEFFKGGPNDLTMPAALIKLEDDQRWVAEVMQVGPIIGVTSPAASEIGRYQVQKRGIGTRLTGGIITAAGGIGGTLPPNVRPDAIIIRPNPNSARPDQSICFSHFTDRGALVVNTSRQPVGLLYDELPIQEGSVTVVHGVAVPIMTVLNGLSSLPNVKFEVAMANGSDIVHTTSSRVVTPHVIATPPSVAGAFARLRDELSQFAVGRLAIAMWTNHGREIRHLIDHNRRVATVWHRSHGPALLQALVRVLQVPSAIMPATVNDMPIAVSIERVAIVLCKYGSAALQTTIADLRSRLPAVAGQSFGEILSTLHHAEG